MRETQERRLWDAVSGGTSPRETIRAMIASGEIHGTTWSEAAKQARATLEKWSREGCYDYGVSLDLGWPVPGKKPRRFG
jgi:hypothetical protein